MAFIHKHTKDDWKIRFMNRFNEEDGECDLFIESKESKNPIGKIEIMMEDFGEHSGYPREQKLADAKLISQAPNLLEFAEILFDEWSQKKKKPMFLEQLRKTIENAGVEITK